MPRIDSTSNRSSIFSAFPGLLCRSIHHTDTEFAAFGAFFYQKLFTRRPPRLRGAISEPRFTRMPEDSKNLVLRRTAHRRHRDMRQRRSRRRAMPMTLACFDMDDIADRDLALLGFRCRKTFARCDDENLITIVDMPAGRRADSEIDHV